MLLTLLFLPVLLPEAPFAITAGVKGRKRSVWKPTILETMEHFIDVQQVFFCTPSLSPCKGYAYCPPCGVRLSISHLSVACWYCFQMAEINIKLFRPQIFSCRQNVDLFHSKSRLQV